MGSEMWIRDRQGVVLVSVENRSMTAFSAADGKTLWRAPHHRGGRASPDDMLVINGLVWSGAVANGTDSGVFTGRDICLGGEGTALEKAAAGSQRRGRPLLHLHLP